MRLSGERLHRYFGTVCDLTALTCSWYMAVLLISAGGLWTPRMLSDADQWWFLLAAVLVFWIPIARSLRIYARRSPEERGGPFLRAVQGLMLVVSIAMILALLFANLKIDIARQFILRFIPISCVTLYLARKLGVFLYAASKWPRRPCLAVVAERVDSGLVDRVRDVKSAVLKGIIVPANGASETHSQPLPVLGTTRDLAAVINRERLDGIILLNGAISEPELLACNTISKRMGVTMGWAIALPEPPSKVSFSYEFGMHVLEMNPVSFTRGERLIKRLFDLVFASVLILLLAPVMVMVALLVKVTSKGPILYSAPRVGRGGRYFTFLKFRTMYTGSDRPVVREANEKDGHIFKMRNDPRVTFVGQALRRYSLDELPQLFNVLAGEMSLVGPRPLPAEDLDPDGLSSRFTVWSEQRATVPPGITGLWQIRGRSELPFMDLIKYDLEYVYNWSLMLDLKILLQTPSFVVSGRGAY
jgi:exopolysaccharide biosynthesis polyprenyl glycosylphosphotransferase